MNNPSPDTGFALDDRQRAMLSAIGVRVWTAPDTPAPVCAPTASTPQARPPEPTHPPPTRTVAPHRPETPLATADTSHMDWAQLQSTVSECRACSLCAHRTHTVFGTGGIRTHPHMPPTAEWLIVGEAPGEQEDAQGEPFVGQAGKLLDNMLAAIGLSRHDGRGGGVYIINTLKCRPPANRNPSAQELTLCAPFLQRQIQLLQPKVILAMGRFAAQALLQHVPDIEKIPLGKLRGQVHTYEHTPVVVTYHPAYLLRSLPDKAKAWEDLVLAVQSRLPPV